MEKESNTALFCRLAIEGGWKVSKHVDFNNPDQVNGLTIFLSKHAQEMALLSPLAWQAVGKVKWVEETCVCGACGSDIHDTTGWQSEWHKFITLLADGKSIEDALGEVLK